MSMGKFHGWMLLLTCAQICEKHFYASGFDIEGAKDECFCADRVRKDAPTALPITLRLVHPKNKEDEPDETYGPAQ